MSRRTLLILIGICILGLLFWAFAALRGTFSNNASGTSGGGLSSLFPFAGLSGNTKETGSTVTLPGTPSGTSTTPQADTALMKISSRVVAGLTVLPPPAPVKTTKTAASTSTTTSSQTAATTAQTGTATNTTDTPTPATDANGNILPVVRFVERGTGFIYDTDAKGHAETEVSGSTVVHAADAIFTDTGKSVAIRYIKDDNRTIATYFGAIVPATASGTAGTLNGTFLPDNVIDYAPSPDQKSIAYIIPTADGAAGYSVRADGSNKKELFASPFSEWLLDWTSGALTVTTKAASGYLGYAYSVNSSGFLTKIFGGISGLTTNISPDGKTILYSTSQGSGLALHIRHLSDGSDVNLGLSTLPEKCVWGADSVTAYCGAPNGLTNATLPDAWYQGSYAFSDALWKIDTKAGTTTVLANSDTPIDVTKPTLDSKGTFLFFINKIDGSLWSLDLTPPAAAPAASAFPSTTDTTTASSSSQAQ